MPFHASPPRSARQAARILVAALTIAGLSLVAPFFVKAASAQGEVALSETGGASANTAYSAGDAPQNAISGDTGARFSSDADQASGMTFEVNMGSAQTFNQIEMTLSSVEVTRLRMPDCCGRFASPGNSLPAKPLFSISRITSQFLRESGRARRSGEAARADATA